MDHPVTDPGDSLRMFLADRDVPCPGCGYNLRGMEGAACPECGRSIELAIKSPSRGRGYLLLVLLTLGWVLMAGTMNGYRAWREVRQQAQPAQRLLTTFTGRSISVTSTGSVTTITTQGNPSTFTFNVGGSTVIRPNFTPASAGGAMMWANVATRSWMSLGWWSGLGVFALTLLIIVIVRRTWFDRETLPRAVIAAACTLFVLYAGYHIAVFTQELL